MVSVLEYLMLWWANFAKEVVKENLKIEALDLQYLICAQSVLMLINSF
jgi:hypothetical protein